LKPDIIITHAYRQYYSTKALKIARKLKIPCVLVTHAPFLDKKLRNWRPNLAVFLYDNLIGKKIINRYSKVFAITNWEIPYLLKLGCKKSKIIIIPNGLPKEFFSTKLRTPKNNKKKVLFMGRIAPIKNLETLIWAVKNLDVSLTIFGPAEKEYKERLLKLMEKESIKNVEIKDASYDRKQQISLLDSYDIYVLPSLREGMPQTLIEAMSRGKLVISSTNEGGKEIINHLENGLLFEIRDVSKLRELLRWGIDKKNSKKISQISKKAISDVKQYSWDKLINKIERIIL